MLTLHGLDEVKAHVGEELGVSDWYEVTQEEINAFAEVTGDHQWIHVDVERAKETPFGGTIAHGFYVLSLAPALLLRPVHVRGLRLRAQLRPQPRPLHLPDARRRQAPDARQARQRRRRRRAARSCMTEVTFEREGGEKPVCVAEQLVRVYTG